MTRAADKWMSGYVRAVLRREAGNDERHLLFCIADHYEPYRGDMGTEEARNLVREWCATYREQFTDAVDAGGCHPQHTFFYPGENYDAVVLEELAAMVRDGYGEVEIHLHHHDDTPESLTEKLTRFREQLCKSHGLLGTDSSGNPCYGFVHGNWALCNSRPDGDWCGVNDELGILSGTGCYADLTMPSAPSPTQSRMVNAIYRAHDTGQPRAHDQGELARVIGSPLIGQVKAPGATNEESGTKNQKQFSNNDSPITDNSLLLIQGPLALNWRWRKWGVLPRLENGEISGANPPTVERLKLWVRQQVHVIGRPEWAFVKLHTHGCVSANQEMLLGGTMRRFHEEMQGWCRENNIHLHYLTAREMFNIARAAEGGHSGDPGQYRDYEISPPACAQGDSD